MELFIKSLLAIHVFAGFMSLILFWIPIFLKKGSKNHVLIGKIYVALMWVVVISAAILSIKNLIIKDYISAAFLGFLTVITANPLWYGIAILKNKRGLTPSYRRKHMTFNLLILIFGLLLFGYGIYLKGQGAGVLMLIFGTLGILTGRDIVVMYKNPKSKSDRIMEHITGMLVSGIAAYTAFLVFGGRSFLEGMFDGYLSIILWVAPTVIGSIGIRFYKKKYQKKQTRTSEV